MWSHLWAPVRRKHRQRNNGNRKGRRRRQYRPLHDQYYYHYFRRGEEELVLLLPGCSVRAALLRATLPPVCAADEPETRPLWWPGAAALSSRIAAEPTLTMLVRFSSAT
jgi:hypothetical protein